jgi:hypothetical protein
MATSEVRLEAGDAAELGKQQSVGCSRFLAAGWSATARRWARRWDASLMIAAMTWPRCARIWRASRFCLLARTGSGFPAANRAVRRDPVTPVQCQLAEEPAGAGMSG